MLTTIDFLDEAKMLVKASSTRDPRELEDIVARFCRRKEASHTEIARWVESVNRELCMEELTKESTISRDRNPPILEKDNVYRILFSKEASLEVEVPTGSLSPSVSNAYKIREDIDFFMNPTCDEIPKEVQVLSSYLPVTPKPVVPEAIMDEYLSQKERRDNLIQSMLDLEKSDAVSNLEKVASRYYLSPKDVMEGTLSYTPTLVKEAAERLLEVTKKIEEFTSGR